MDLIKILHFLQPKILKIFKFNFLQFKCKKINQIIAYKFLKLNEQFNLLVKLNK